MVEHVGWQCAASLAARHEEAKPLDQGDAARSGVRRWRCHTGDVIRDVVCGKLDNAKPLGDRQGANGGDELLDCHGMQDATLDGMDASMTRALSLADAVAIERAPASAVLVTGARELPAAHAAWGAPTPGLGLHSAAGAEGCVSSF